MILDLYVARHTQTRLPCYVHGGAHCSGGSWIGLDQAANLCRAGAAALFFSASGGFVLPLSMSLGADCCHAHDGGARIR